MLHLHTLLDTFGPTRMFGDPDGTRMPGISYERIQFFATHLPWLKGEVLDWVMGRAVCEWLLALPA